MSKRRPMTDDRIDELLIEWDLRRQSEDELTVEDLCADCPELQEPLLQRIRRLRATDWLFDDNVPDGTTPFGNITGEQADAELLDAARQLSLEELRARLLGSDLLSPMHRQSVEERLTDTVNCGSLLETLVGDNVLTPFQAKTLCAPERVPLVLGDYVLLDLLGAGGMGQVYRARHRQLNRIVALKILPQALIADPLFRQRFQREIQALSTLTHPNIVAAYDAREEQGVCFLSMECVDGEDLHARVRREGPLDSDTALDVITQAAKALEFAHANGVVHRDIKPSNLLQTNEGVIKVADFGLAQIEQSAESDGTPDASLTATGLVLGSLDFLAPEQAHSARDADQRSDIYSLGCTYYYLLTGRAPFPGDNPVQKLVAHREHDFPQVPNHLDGGVSGELNRTLQRMTAKSPADRYQSATECLADLERLRDVLNGSLPGQRVGQKRRGTRIAAGLLAGLILLLGVVVYFHTGDGKVAIHLNRDDVELEVDGEKREFTIVTPQKQITVSVPSGEHSLKVTTGDGLEFHAKEFSVFRNRTTELTAVFVPLGEGPANRSERSFEPKPHGVAVEASEDDKDVRSLKVANLPVSTVAISPDSKKALFSAGGLQFVDLETRQITMWIPYSPSWRKLTHVQYSPDGTRILASAAADNTIRIWKSDSLALVHELAGHTGEILTVAFSRDGRHVISTSKDKTVRLWSCETGHELKQIGEHSEGVISASLSHDSRYLLATFPGESGNPSLRIWDVEDGTELQDVAHYKAFKPVAEFVPGKREFLLTNSRNHPQERELQLFRICDFDRRTLRSFCDNRLAGQCQIRLTEDGKRALAAVPIIDDERSTLQLWDLETASRVASLTRPAGQEFQCIALSSDGLTAAAGTRDGQIVVWKLPAVELAN